VRTTPAASLVLAALASAAVAACGGSPRPPAVTPPPACPSRLAPRDVSTPTTVVGAGTPAGCTAAALQAALTAGGTVVFDCGAAPVTIPVASTLRVTKETTLDGGGRVTLSGGGAARILLLDSGYDVATPRLTVQRLAFVDGRSARVAGDDTASGGAAIYRDGGSLTVIDCTFTGNHAPSTGQDLAGGAIYAFGGGETVVSGSTFTGNSASDGGAIGSLNGDLVIVDSTFDGNQALGTGGNPGNGGCGGALYQDGRDEVTALCGVAIRGSTAGHIGGGVFRVSNDATGTFTMDRSTVDGSTVTDGNGNAGGLYLQGLSLAITASSVSRNRAFYNGGLWINAGHADLTNVTISGNEATGSNGGGLWLGNSPTGTLLNCTIAGNRATAAGQVAGAIFGAGLTLKNTLVSGNTAMYRPSCDVVHASGGGNLQWTGVATGLCTAAPTVADPLLGPLVAGGGPTETMAPSAGSPARRLGTGCPATDQRGQPRAEPCTAGAVEVP